MNISKKPRKTIRVVKKEVFFDSKGKLAERTISDKRVKTGKPMFRKTRGGKTSKTGGGKTSKTRS